MSTQRLSPSDGSGPPAHNTRAASQRRSTSHPDNISAALPSPSPTSSSVRQVAPHSRTLPVSVNRTPSTTAQNHEMNPLTQINKVTSTNFLFQVKRQTSICIDEQLYYNKVN